MDHYPPSSPQFWVCCLCRCPMPHAPARLAATRRPCVLGSDKCLRSSLSLMLMAVNMKQRL
jgi:hypothetical protein